MLKRICSLSACVLLCTSLSFAAVPKDTVIVDDKAYHIEYMNTDDDALSDVLDALDKNSRIVYYKLSSGTIINVEDGGSEAKITDIPVLTYYNQKGVMSIYDKHDGDVIDGSFHIVDIK